MFYKMRSAWGWGFRVVLAEWKMKSQRRWSMTCKKGLCSESIGCTYLWIAGNEGMDEKGST